MNAEVHEVLHGAVVERIQNLEHDVANLNEPENGILAKMGVRIDAAVDDKVGKLEAKINWLIAFIFTLVCGSLGTVLLNKFAGTAAGP